MRRVRAWLRKTSWGGLLDPLLGTLGNEMQKWWARQPWRQSVLVVKDAVSAELSPWVRRYPIASVCIMAAAGAAVAGSGVWRWRAVRHSAAQLGRQLRHSVIGQLTSPTMQALLLAALASYLTPKRGAEPPADSPAAPEDDAPAGPG